MKLEKIGDIKKFSFAEMTSNNNGKTSATSVAGLYIVAIGGFCFFLGVLDKMFLDKSIDIINQAVVMTSIGAALLGVKNIYNGSKAQAKAEEPTQLNS